MDWRVKALIQTACAAMPKGDAVYTKVQRRFGNLQADPFRRIAHALNVCRLATEHGAGVQGARVLELGTGHVPSVPIFLSLLGADSVVTVDLHRRIQWDLVSSALQQISDARDSVVDRLSPFTAQPQLEERIEIAGRHGDDPHSALARLGIEYRSPADARQLTDPDGSFDLCMSVTTMEHIPPASIAEILSEERRLLGPDGLAIHLVDLADHYAENGSGITKVNFLTVPEWQWKILGSNRFAYCNRLRSSEYSPLFERAGFRVLALEGEVDQDAMRALQAGLTLGEAWSAYTMTDVCTVSLGVVAQPLVRNRCDDPGQP